MRLRAGYEKYDFLEKYVSFSPQRHIRLNAAIFETHPPQRQARCFAENFSSPFFKKSNTEVFKLIKIKITYRNAWFSRFSWHSWGTSNTLNTRYKNE
jgi:hypothetical protein